MRTFWQGCRRPADPAGLLVARPWLGTSPSATSLSTLGCRCRRPACRMALAEDKPQRYISLDSRLSVSPARLPHGPGWGQAPALQPPLPTLWIPASAGMTSGGDSRTDAGMTGPTVVAGTIHGTRIGVRESFSYQSPMPAAAGTPRYEKPELWFGAANWHGGFCHAPPRPQRGTSPRATFSHSAIGHRSTIRHVSPVESRHQG